MTQSFGKLSLVAALSLVCFATAPAVADAGAAAGVQSGILAGPTVGEVDRATVSRSLPRRLLGELLRAPAKAVHARSGTSTDADLHSVPPDGRMRVTVNALGRSGCYFDPLPNDDGPRVCSGPCQQASDCGPRCFTCGFESPLGAGKCIL